jgi:hypothetical protein
MCRPYLLSLFAGFDFDDVINESAATKLLHYIVPTLMFGLSCFSLFRALLKITYFHNFLMIIAYKNSLAKS